ncbi:hypothetical protein PR202_ga28206 [Eleusine coracana subsp. coracana]|uniref:DUF1618 domain-containing protein n=1 Tax=Eleusine coracana subsp. coracana TaxID=191504 RepID=A0AAV5DGK7_ELECO|nr:hypothetical protein PR202_ga28206 [Eleusine coracana subsp. coracana]
MTTAAFPSWIMLERFVFRRDDEESFPNAPISVRGVTSWDAPFFVAFCLAEPPLVSRIYARLPGFPDPRKQTDTVVPFNRYLCWIDYYRGILFCDVFAEPTPTVYFHRFHLKEFPSTPNRSKTSSWLYRGATAIDDTVLMFVDVERNDGIGYGKLKPSAGFTISCYSLRLNGEDDPGVQGYFRAALVN